MSRGRSPFVGVAAAVVLVASSPAPPLPSSAAAAPGRSSGTGMTAAAGTAGGSGSFVLAATSTGAGYAPTFTGNGYLGVRVPAAGQGYAGGSVPAKAAVAGFYAQPPGQVQQRADLPSWSALTFGDGASTVSGWRQQLDLRTGVITTTGRWAASNGQVTDLRYDVLTDRARPHVAVVRLRLTPRWAGTARVTDLIDGTPAMMTAQVAKGWDLSARQSWETVRAQGTGLLAGLAGSVGLGENIQGAMITPVVRSASRSVGLRLAFPVTAGRTYEVTKYVGVVTSHEAVDASAAAGAGADARRHADVADAARRHAADAVSAGFAAILAENAAAWARLWKGRVDVIGDPALATKVNASEFYLWASTRENVGWSVSPAGLSSGGYGGHVFWDAETWMYPALLAQHPELAEGMNDYRLRLLPAAEAHARATGYRGARFPWESALDGTEQIPPPPWIHSQGLYEQHITADIALAQWQYYLVTGDRAWLADRGWPVLSRAAEFWASRVTRDADGAYHIKGVTGPDEGNPNVDDEAYTNVAAAATLRIAGQAAEILGRRVPPSWAAISKGLVLLTSPATGTHPEFAGYQGQMVKQADVTMLQYPWERPMAATTAQNDIDYYVPRTDPGGPAMSDAINAIDTAALGSPGCSSFVFTQRSVEPFIRDPFHQFSETRAGGAFTFITGIGGFLQEFLYGYSGLRWGDRSIRLDPVLTAQLSGLVLHDLRWQGRRFTVSIGPSTTKVLLDQGPALPVTTGNTTRFVAPGHTLTLRTRRPDLTPTTDLARCGPATASGSQPGAGPLAAVDGSPATDWRPAGLPATLTVPLSRPATLSAVTVTWERKWPPNPAPNVPPPPGPVVTLRPGSYEVLVSRDGHAWTRVAQIDENTSGTMDKLTFPPVRAGFVQVKILTSAAAAPPRLTEIIVPSR